MIPNLYNANYQIFQTRDYLVLVMEMIHEARIIPLTEMPHASNRIRQWLGDSRGYWSGVSVFRLIGPSGLVGMRSFLRPSLSNSRASRWMNGNARCGNSGL